MNKNIAVFALTMLVTGTIATTSSNKVFADWLIDGSGTLMRVDGSILGDDDIKPVEVKTEDQSTQTRSAESARESAQDQAEAKREAEKQRLEKSRETLKNQVEARKKIQEKTGQTSQFELRSEGGKLKLKQEIKNAQGTITSRRELELKAGEALHVEQNDGETAQINAVEDGEIEITKNRIKAHSDLELKVGEKNDISVTLPNGKTRSISIPDQALEHLIANGVITPPVSGSPDTNYTLIAGQNGEPVYVVPDAKVAKRLFGLSFLPSMEVSSDLEVAAADNPDIGVVAGDIVSQQTTETSPLRRFLARFMR